ncbi:hypothetical protein K491DRAFT_686527 [Lophiostoma macrostomum CBS 122681]|uniref:Uncharacterized protein n=1 Tax=Lophiostoma macrostomum CBS 122681 TaxID=1314788 RepID=A0A6A6TTZ6_9PLEO|nr:hypothetical protein K491DRAFT_686527 [Lophiostoma macrostomum CBS 122681]
MDAPSAQLHLEIRDAIVRGLATRRPLLHHLNADTSWLLQVPRPASAIKHGSRIYYNILIDPWFIGGQSDVARWFSQQWHATESAVKSVAEVEELARQVEILSGGLRLGKGRKVNGELKEEESLIDVVAISHEFTDHCHKETLLEVHPNCPVFATQQAAKLISTYKHFRTVVTTPTFSAYGDTDWRSHSIVPLPQWLSISRLTASRDALFYHSALLICFATHPFLPTTPKKRSSLLTIHGDEPSSTPSSAEAAECVIYTPHGIPFTSLAPIESADPPLHTLAFLHGLHDVAISSAQQLNLGAKNGLQAQRILKAKYWVSTHDEIKIGGGFVGWFLKRKIWTIEDALKEARAEALKKGDVNVDGDEFDDVRFEEVSNGESRVLE